MFELPPIRHTRRYHPHTPGLLFVGTTVLVLLGALNSGNNLLYWMFGLAIGAVIVSGVLSGSSLMGLRITAYPPDPVAAGGVATFRYELRNTNRWMPAVALALEDTSTSPDAPILRGWVASLPAGETLIVEVRAQTGRRGIYDYPGLRALTTFPFGLTRKSVCAHQQRSLIVRPRAANIRSSVLIGTLGGGPRMRRTNAHLGLRGEPYGLREYAPGDPFRSIAWRASARTGELRVIEESLPARALFRVAFSLAANSSQDVADAAVELAAGVCMTAARHGIPVLVDGVDESPTGRSAIDVGRTLDALASLDPRGMKPPSIHARGAVVISDATGSGRSDTVLDVGTWITQRTASLNPPQPSSRTHETAEGITA